MVDVAVYDPALGELGGRLAEALEGAGLPAADPGFERPKDPDHGDWATTVALRLAGPAKRPPREIAQQLVESLDLPASVASAEVAGPGFVNFRLAPAYWQDLLRRIVAEGSAYGRRVRPPEERERVNGEFVSANPTGPLHVGHGRWVATGDAIAALLEADGHEVHREYYLNDAGVQVTKLGASVLAVARDEPRDPDHYQGEYVAELVERLRAAHGDEVFAGGREEAVERVGRLAVGAMTDEIRDTLASMGVVFDTWFSERSLHDSGAVEKAVAALSAAGHTEERDGAVFLRTTDFGDDKDRVLVKSDGDYTYFAADCAYVRDKVDRGYTRLLYLLGADHHGYVKRMHALAQAMDLPEGTVEIRIGQLVNVLRGGQPVKMSKRAGEFITLQEVVDEVGGDVARYHFLRVGLDTTQDFDLELVTAQSNENPVYYVQYAHARIASLLRTADASGFDPGDVEVADLTVLDHPAETELLRRLAVLPLVVAEAAELRATQRLAHYAEDLAGAFHRFYTECQVLGDDVPETRSRARYWLAVAAKHVLGNALGILRVDAPDRM